MKAPVTTVTAAAPPLAATGIALGWVGFVTAAAAVVFEQVLARTIRWKWQWHGLMCSRLAVDA